MENRKINENKELARNVNIDFPFLDTKQRQLIYLFAINIREIAIKKAKQEEAEKWHNQLRKLQKHETERVKKAKQKMINDLKQTTLNKHTINLLKKKHKLE